MQFPELTETKTVELFSKYLQSNPSKIFPPKTLPKSHLGQKFQKLQINPRTKLNLCSPVFSTYPITKFSMTSLQKLRNPHFLRFTRFFRSESSAHLKRSGKNICEVRKEAQNALLDYLHSTRNLQFMDAENMSKNTPEFFDRLMKGLDTNDADAGRSLTRFLRYHPINEFEPFFESIGLRPSDYSSFLPRNLMFLNDDQFLLDNYYVLCNYGVPRNLIGKIYKEAMEVFSYNHGVLQSKLRAFQDSGVKQSFAIKIVVSSPYLLKQDTNYNDLLEVLGNLNNVGIGHDWVEERISKGCSCNWKQMLGLVRLLNELGLNDQKLGELIRCRPDILLDSSGGTTFRFVSFLLKFGLTKNNLQSVILEFPPIPVPKFAANLHRCYTFMVGIKMPAQDIGPIFRSHPLLIGSCELKGIRSLKNSLNCGVNMLSRMVKEDPYVLKNWVLRLRPDRVQEPNRVLRARTLKTQFLLSIGFVENSKEIEKALKLFCGKGMELEERFDCLVSSTGLSRDDVIAMVKAAPRILNQSKDVIRAKIGFFVNELGLPVSDLVTHPATLSYTVQRVDLRLSTYKWLRDEGVVHKKLRLSTLFACSEDTFMMTYVNAHPKGPEFWKRLKKEIYCE